VGTPRRMLSWLTGQARQPRPPRVFSFSLTVPERDAYRIEVGQGRGVVPFARSDLERTSWKADLTIGAYTMFGGI